MKTIRNLHLVGATGEIRTAIYDSREHLVVPVVAMVEGVVWAVNSDVPEFVPAEELAETPQQWNGRGCFAGHPAVDGQQVTANSPRILEQSFGTIFDVASGKRILETRRLEFEAFLDPEKAKAVGRAAESVIDRLRAGKRVEVSVGCFVEAEQKDGIWNGKEYHSVWRSIVSDHIAFLAEGEVGACSIEAGCGAPRAAVRHMISAEGIRREEQVAEKKKRSMRERFSELLGHLRANDADPGVSDAELRGKLNDALRAIEPGFMGVYEVYPADNLVIYEVCPADEWKTMRRSYSTAEDGSITLEGEGEQVEAVVTYEPAMKSAENNKPCPCGGRQAAAVTVPTTTGVTTMTDKTKARIAESGGKYTEADAPWIELMSDERFASLVQTQVAAPANEPKALTRAEIFAADPSLKVIVEGYEAREAAEKAELVTKLAAASSVLTKEQLAAKPVDELRTLASFAKIETLPVDHSGRGAARVPVVDAGENYEAPKPYDEPIKALRAAVQVN